MSEPGSWDRRDDPWWPGDGEQDRGDPAAVPVAYQPPVPRGAVPQDVQLSDDRQIAGYGRRASARLIDVALLVLFMVVATLTLGDVFGRVVTTSNGASSAATYVVAPVGILLCLAYLLVTDVVLVRVAGGQPGKLVLGIRVASADDVSSPIGWGRALGRWAILALAFALCLLPGLLFFLSPLWGYPARQGWHDKMVHTLVTARRRP